MTTDDRIASLIEQHDNTFSLSKELLDVLNENPGWTNNYDQTASCYAAALGRNALANGLLTKFGGGEIRDFFGKTAQMYLSTGVKENIKHKEDCASFDNIDLKDKLRNKRIPQPIFPARKSSDQD